MLVTSARTFDTCNQTDFGGALSCLAHAPLLRFLNVRLRATVIHNRLCRGLLDRAAERFSFQFSSHSCAAVSFEEDCQAEVSGMCFTERSSPC